MSRNKATFLVITVAVIIFGLIFGLYFYFSKDNVNIDTEEDGGFFRSFFPFGGSSSGTDDSRGDFLDDIGGDTEVPILRKISNEPISGFYIFSSEDTEGEDVSLIRYTQRATGHIYEASSSSLSVRRISNMTIPKITEAIWISEEDVIYRYLDDDNETIRTFLLKLEKKDGEEDGTFEEGEYLIEGNYLEDDIKEITVSSQGEIFYLTSDQNSSYGTKVDLALKKTNLFKSSLREWLIKWSSGRSIWFVSKPSLSYAGYAYTLNSQSGNFSKIFSGLRGLSILPNMDNSKLLYSHIRSTGPTLAVFNVSEFGSNDLGIQTLSDKCVWGSVNTSIIYCAIPRNIGSLSLPDDWYKGKVLFSDSIWEINIETGSAELVFSVSDEAGEDIDAIDLSLSPEGDYLLFKNKRDLSLWSLRVDSEE